MSDESYEIGRITILLTLTEDHQLVTVETPDTDDVPMIVQLGMVEMAREEILHPNGDAL